MLKMMSSVSAAVLTISVAACNTTGPTASAGGKSGFAAAVAGAETRATEDPVAALAPIMAQQTGNLLKDAALDVAGAAIETAAGAAGGPVGAAVAGMITSTVTNAASDAMTGASQPDCDEDDSEDTSCRPQLPF